jgi:hypothetical protein
MQLHLSLHEVYFQPFKKNRIKFPISLRMRTMQTMIPRNITISKNPYTFAHARRKDKTISVMQGLPKVPQHTLSQQKAL